MLLASVAPSQANQCIGAICGAVAAITDHPFEHGTYCVGTPYSLAHVSADDEEEEEAEDCGVYLMWYDVM